MSESESAFYTRILIASAAVLVVGWLSVSFSKQGRLRSVLEWVSAVAMYSAIGSIMFRLLHRFWIEDRIALVGLFGFLVLVFGSGLLVSLVMTIRAAVGKDIGEEAGATP
ncbi:hypothetical protein MYXO_03125 [Myxococcaceae bacterium]|nr:hypothetical protein MYXO_03125 [Myxococcaceae bacterium]